MLTKCIAFFIPLVGTTLGSFAVFFLRDGIPEKAEKLLLGFASGVMVAASVWSLLIPAMEISESAGMPPWLHTSIGFLLGIFFLLLLDTFIPHMHAVGGSQEGPSSGLGRNVKLLLAVTIHNIPEGMAVGAAYASMVGVAGSRTAALSLAVGIAIQNFPEGAIISMPLRDGGLSKMKAFLFGFLSGVVEPMFAFLTLAFASSMTSSLPYMLPFAAGAMIYVVIEELVPSSQEGKHSNAGTIGFAFGFVMMMALDVIFS